MDADRSFTELMDRVRAGDDAAATEVFQRFARRLIVLTQRRLNHLLRPKVDPEDVMQSVYRSFFRQHAQGHYEFADWDGLWGMLTVIAVRKCGHQINHFRAERRDVCRETTATAACDALDAEFQFIARDPTPSHAARLAETVELLMRGLEGRERDILMLSLQGHQVREISEQVGRTERTVQRVLKGIRERLQQMQEPTE